MYSRFDFSSIKNKQNTDKDISFLKNALYQLRTAQSIASIGEPFWYEQKFVSFLHPSKSEVYRKSFNYPFFQIPDPTQTPFDGSTECSLTDPVTIDLCIKEKPSKTPFVLKLYNQHSGFSPILYRSFETEEKMHRYFEKLKTEIELDFKRTLSDLTIKIEFVENELVRCNALRKEKMLKNGSA